MVSDLSNRATRQYPVDEASPPAIARGSRFLTALHSIRAGSMDWIRRGQAATISSRLVIVQMRELVALH